MNIIEDKLNHLLEEGKISIQTLECITGLDSKTISLFLTGEGVLSDSYEENSRWILRLTEIAMMLDEGMKISDNERIKGIIDVLCEVYKMKYKEIACCIGIEEREIINFLNKPEQVSYEKRYQLAVKISMLNLVFKN